MELQATRQAVAAAAAALACWNVPLSQTKQPRSVIAPELEMAPRRDRLCASLQKVSCHRSARAWWHRTLTTRHVLGPPHVRRRRVSGAEIAMWGCSAMGHHAAAARRHSFIVPYTTCHSPALNCIHGRRPLCAKGSWSRRRGCRWHTRPAPESTRPFMKWFSLRTNRLFHACTRPLARPPRPSYIPGERYCIG